MHTFTEQTVTSEEFGPLVLAVGSDLAHKLLVIRLSYSDQTREDVARFLVGKKETT
jgi:hypothetical protein